MSNQPKKIIAKCISEFESKTQVELVLVIEPESANYWNYIFGYTLIACYFFWGLTLFFDMEFINEFIYIESILLSLVIIFLLHSFQLVAFLIPKRIKHKNVLNKMIESFAIHKIFNTKNRSGVLLYYSRIEKIGKIFPDQGALSHISEGELLEFEKQFLAALNHKNFADELGSFIRTFGVFWARKWPRESFDNELSNDVIGNLK